MKRALSYLAVLASLYIPIYGAAHAEWKDKNSEINATNFIIMDRGNPICSATLISLKFHLVITANHCMEDFISTKKVDETNADGEVKNVEKEVLDPVTLAQKSYQGYDLVGSSTYEADIVAHEKKVDMTLLKIRGDSVPQTIAAKMLPADRKVERGEKVWIVGNPLGTLDATLTSGIVSNTTRKFKTPWADEEEVAFIQTDAAINGGNSGGSMRDDDGFLIGIPDAGWRGANGLGLTLTPESMRAFLKRHCYAEVYDEKQTRHDCVQEKRKIENLKRDKRGLPPLKDDEGPQE
jgi:hypothetical protein